MNDKRNKIRHRTKHGCGVGFLVHIKGTKTNQLVRQADEVLINLEHRGACGAEENTGDGAGMLLQIPHRFFQRVCTEIEIDLPDEDGYGVGMVYLPMDDKERRLCEETLERIVEEEGQTVLGWRTVPTQPEGLGSVARQREPMVRQIFVGRNDDALPKTDELAFERKLYVIRRRAENKINSLQSNGTSGELNPFYFASFSCRTIVYKGMLLCAQVTEFYPELRDPDMESAIVVVHSRFSTNTFPSWERAHPYRYIIHNGEINTIRGNENWMAARQMTYESDLWGDDLKKILPIIDPEGSDSAKFDNCLEFLALSGRSLPHVMMMMIPEPWSNNKHISPEKQAFYAYHSTLMEPWDGPASIGFTDGRVVGAVLDRNGLRPSRYYVTKDDIVIMASEVGVLDVPPENVLEKNRLQPGRMFLVDTEQGRIISDEELKQTYALAHPYQEWLSQYMIELTDLPKVAGIPNTDRNTLVQRQQAFGYTFEGLRMLLAPMAVNAVEALGAMGNDAPHAVLSDQSQLLYSYFRQLFAQVTNPPVDGIREELVMATDVMLGGECNQLDTDPESARRISIPTPFLKNEELAQLRDIDQTGFKSQTLPILFKADSSHC